MSEYRENADFASLKPFSADEAADLLGLSRQACWRACRLGQLPGAFRVGTRWFVARPALMALLTAGGREARQ